MPFAKAVPYAHFWPWTLSGSGYIESQDPSIPHPSHSGAVTMDYYTQLAIAFFREAYLWIHESVFRIKQWEMVIKKFKEEICEGKRSQSSNFIYISMAEKNRQVEWKIK